MVADFFSSLLTGGDLNGWDFLLAIAVLIAGWIGSNLAHRATLTLIHRWPGVSEGAAKLAARIVRYSILLLTFGVVLTVLGASLQPVLAAAIIITAIAVLALRGIAANFGAGVLIQARGTVHIGDEIEVLDEQGTVRELNGRSVTLLATDGRTVRIPNAALLDSPLINYTEHGSHRSELEVRVTSDLPPAELALLITASLPTAKDAPPPAALLIRSAPNSLTFRVRFWHGTDDRLLARAGAVTALTESFRQRGISAAIEWPVPPPPPLPPAASPG